jgi:hypothetical protein
MCNQKTWKTWWRRRMCRMNDDVSECGRMWSVYLNAKKWKLRIEGRICGVVERKNHRRYWPASLRATAFSAISEANLGSAAMMMSQAPHRLCNMSPSPSLCAFLSLDSSCCASGRRSFYRYRQSVAWRKASVLLGSSSSSSDDVFYEMALKEHSRGAEIVSIVTFVVFFSPACMRVDCDAVFQFCLWKLRQFFLDFAWRRWRREDLGMEHELPLAQQVATPNVS